MEDDVPDSPSTLVARLVLSALLLALEVLLALAGGHSCSVMVDLVGTPFSLLFRCLTLPQLFVVDCWESDSIVSATRRRATTGGTQGAKRHSWRELPPESSLPVTPRRCQSSVTRE